MPVPQPIIDTHYEVQFPPNLLPVDTTDSLGIEDIETDINRLVSSLNDLITNTYFLPFRVKLPTPIDSIDQVSDHLQYDPEKIPFFESDKIYNNAILNINIDNIYTHTNTTFDIRGKMQEMVYNLNAFDPTLGELERSPYVAIEKYLRNNAILNEVNLVPMHENNTARELRNVVDNLYPTLYQIADDTNRYITKLEQTIAILADVPANDLPPEFNDFINLFEEDINGRMQLDASYIISSTPLTNGEYILGYKTTAFEEGLQFLNVEKDYLPYTI